MRKISNEVRLYLLFTAVMLFSWIAVIALYHPLFISNKPLDYHDMPALAIISSCMTGEWFVLSVLFLLTFISNNRMKS